MNARETRRGGRGRLCIFEATRTDWYKLLTHTHVPSTPTAAAVTMRLLSKSLKKTQRKKPPPLPDTVDLDKTGVGDETHANFFSPKIEEERKKRQLRNGSSLGGGQLSPSPFSANNNPRGRPSPLGLGLSSNKLRAG